MIYPWSGQYPRQCCWTNDSACWKPYQKQFSNKAEKEEDLMEVMDAEDVLNMLE